MEEIARERIHAAQIIERAQTCLFACVAFSLGDRDTQLLRLPFDRLERRDVLHERYELECVAPRVTAEAVEKSLGGHDGERRRLFAVERAAAPVTSTLAPERHIALHDGEDVGRCAHLLH